MVTKNILICYNVYMLTTYLLLLRRIYKITLFRIIMYKIWEIYSIIKLWFFCMKNNDFFYHYGLFGKSANTGDIVLYNGVENLFDKIMDIKNIWYHRLAFGEITFLEIILINKYCKLLIVGGHGLLMPESNINKNSGWGFNIKLENLKKIKIPIVFFAIGYNIFSEKDKFNIKFKNHLIECVHKSLFFGLRDYGSINFIKSCLPDNLHEKINFQPCPTTMINIYKNNFIDISNNTASEIAISVAFNRFKDRFSKNYLNVFEQIIKYCEYMKRKGYKISFTGHHILDIHNKHSKHFGKYGFKIFPLYKYNEKYVLDYYKNKKLVISMRGHGLMIPFGLNVPIISITTQSKQKWFIETIRHDEWNINIDDNIYDRLIMQSEKIINNYSYIKNEMYDIQKNNMYISEKNIKYIIDKINVKIKEGHE